MSDDENVQVHRYTQDDGTIVEIRITADGKVQCTNCQELQKSMKPHLTSESKRASNKCDKPNLIDILRFLKELTAYKKD